MKRILASLAGMALVAPAVGQTVTVNSAGGADHTTITAAIAAVKANAATPDVINITGVGPYVESFIIDSSVTIKGDGVTPLIKATGTSGGAIAALNGRAIAITTATGPVTVRLENLRIIPNEGASVARAIMTANNVAPTTSDPITVEIVDVLVTANDGAGVPVTTTGLSSGITTTATYFTDDLLFFDGIVDATITNSVISHATPGAASTSPDGIVFFPDVAGKTLTINGGSVLSYTGRMGIQLATDGSSLVIQGTSADPVLLLETGLGGQTINSHTIGGNGNNAAVTALIDATNAAITYPAVVDLEYVNIIGGGHNGVYLTAGDVSESLSTLSLDNVVIADMDKTAILIGGDTQNPITIIDSTIVNNGGGPINLDEVTAGASTSTVTITNSIIAGDGTVDADNTFAIDGANWVVNATSSAFVTAGAYSLSAAITNPSSATVNQTSVINADPQFTNINNPSGAGFVAVGNAAYTGAGSGGSNITGAAGDSNSSVSEWSLY